MTNSGFAILGQEYAVFVADIILFIPLSRYARICILKKRVTHIYTGSTLLFIINTTLHFP